MPTPPRTERLTLRAYAPSDIGFFVRLFTDRVVMEHVDGAISSEQARSLFTSVLDGTSPRVHTAWVACAGHLPIAHVALLHFEEDLELGYLLPQSSWGQGYATEVAQAAADYARQTLGLARLLATVDLDHGASIRVLEKVGMTPLRRESDDEGDYLIYSTSWAGR